MPAQNVTSPEPRCAVCRATALALLCSAETIGRDLARARRGLDGFLHDEPRAVYWCRSCGSACRDPRTDRGDDVARYRSCRYRPDALEALARRGRAELDRRAGRLRACGVVAGARLLEIGSYAGAFLEFAGEAGARVTGIDVNPDVVAHCRRRGHEVRGEAFEPALFRAGSFDGVWILNCFEQLPDHARVLAGAARLLRPGGTLVIRTPNARFVRCLYASPAGALLRPAARANALLGVPFATCFSPAALVRAIEEHGLSVERVEGQEFSALAPARATGRLLSPWLEVTARRTAPAVSRRARRTPPRGGGGRRGATRAPSGSAPATGAPSR